MNITIINDCRDDNAAGRQSIRVSSLLSAPVSYIGVTSDLEAAGNLIDTLDAYGDAPGVVLVNVAPRHGAAKKWENGTPFGYFWHRQVLVVTSIDGFTLSLVKKLQLTDSVAVLDIKTVVPYLVKDSLVSKEEGERIVGSQFRSFDFLPRIAAYLFKHKTIESIRQEIETYPDAPESIWWVDNFGNCKTTILADEIKNETNIETVWGLLPCYVQLKSVPDQELAVTKGSSGLGEKRFVEIVRQGASASLKLNVKTGDRIK